MKKPLLDYIAPEDATGLRRYVPGLLLLAWGLAAGGFAHLMGWLS